MRSALRSAVETNSPGPLTETCSCSISPKSRIKPRAAFNAAFAMTFKIAERMTTAVAPGSVRSVLGPLEIAAVGSANDDAGPRLDVRRDHHAAPVFELARLV